MSRHRPPPCRAAAFTLIEVLVVAAVMALLTAILLPSMSHAREKSRQLVCRNNLRAIWSGVVTYSLQNRDRVPFMEDVNLTTPHPALGSVDADPFSPDPLHATTVCRVLGRYVVPGSWVCPSAVTGFARSRGRGGWKMTYSLSVAGQIGKGIPYDQSIAANTGGPLDPVMSNYVHFDGRPIRLIDGRRYVQSPALNRNRKGYWNVRFPIISDALGGQPATGRPIYPHFGQVNVRTDLGNVRPQFEINTQGNGAKPAYHELHADGDRASILFTRNWQAHWPGY
jgi:type II secretory pathway pseudopilin PulG